MRTRPGQQVKHRDHCICNYIAVANPVDKKSLRHNDLCMRTRHWPLFGLRVVTPRLELRYPDDELAVTLAELAAAGVHDPADMPFMYPWTDVPSPEQERNSLLWHWRTRVEWRPESWNINFAVIHEGTVVGMQGIQAEAFPVLRTVTTGSWLGLPFQKRGFGKQMRAAVLFLAFRGLGALEARSGAFDDNPSSRRVSEAMGYEPNGIDWGAPRGVRKPLTRFRLTRERWELFTPKDGITVEGLEDCLPMFGL